MFGLDVWIISALFRRQTLHTLTMCQTAAVGEFILNQWTCYCSTLAHHSPPALPFPASQSQNWYVLQVSEGALEEGYKIVTKSRWASGSELASPPSDQQLLVPVQKFVLTRPVLKDGGTSTHPKYSHFIQGFYILYFIGRLSFTLLMLLLSNTCVSVRTGEIVMRTEISEWLT